MAAAPAFAPETAAWYHADPDAAFRDLRASEPIHWHEPGGFWCITKHADVQAISQHSKTFSSAHGTQLFEVKASNEILVSEDEADSIIRTDPPIHNRLRKLVIGSFTPKRVGEMEGWIRRIARESLDAVDPSGPVELVDQIAVPLPMFVIADLLGFPKEDLAIFRRWSDVVIDAGGGVFSEETAGVFADLQAYVGAVTRERRASPRRDLISGLVEAEVDGERLSDKQVASFCLTLLVAGNETTRNLISGGALALARNPEQRERLLAEPELLPNAVEEMLRYVSPIRNFIRRALEDTELRGQTIRRGDYVALFYSSANRDEEVFGPDANRFEVAREDAHRHVAFGFGEHFCLGASLARLETRVMFEELLGRWPRFELAEEPLLLDSTLINGVVRMPVELGASCLSD